MKISVVVPVYNVELYIDECVESILRQTVEDMEIIIVDDGSTDKSGELCEQWAKKDRRIVVYHKRNGGLMSAWKYGVERANGDYIGFVDSDDWVDDNMFSTLVKAADENDADLVLCGLHCNLSDGTEFNETIHLEPGVYTAESIERNVFPGAIVFDRVTQRGVSPNRVTKLFRRDKLMTVLEMCDERVSIGEDLLTTFLYLSRVQRMVVLDGFYPYHYRINNSSMSQTYSDQKYEKIKILKECLEKSAKEHTYDFSEQISQDMLALFLLQLEREVLFSGRGFKELKSSIALRCKEFLSGTDFTADYMRKFSVKYRLYLFLLCRRLFGAFIITRRLKKAK